MWEGINKIINNKRSCYQPDIVISVRDKNGELSTTNETPDIFNNFFTSIADHIRSNIRQSKKTFTDYLPKTNETRFFFKLCCPDEVSEMINSLKSGKSNGPNSIPTWVLKSLTDVFSHPLSYIFNLSLMQGIFPDAFKLAKVIPVFKKGQRNECSNYRPISLLSNLGKLLEKVVHRQLYNFLDHENLLYDLQFGFRLKTSTNHALISIIDKIQTNQDNGLLSCGVFVDLQKAFDTVDHSILVTKLNHYGVRGPSLEWFKSYMSDRNQFVHVNNVSSTTKPVKHGVPQGSVLGPLLFIIFINDLHRAISNSTVHHFADDTNLLLSNKSLKKLTLNMNHDLTCLCEWLRSNKVALNVDKTEVIIFKKPYTKLNFKYKFKIDGHKVLPKSTIKYLGLEVDDHITWKPFINSLKNKLTRAVGVLSKLRHNVPLSFLKTVYHALFGSHINYGCQVWGLNSESHIQAIQKLQNRAIRNITFSDIRANASPIFKELNILKFEDLIHLYNCTFMYQMENFQLPKTFNTFSSLVRNEHNYNTRASSAGLHVVPTVNTRLYGTLSIKNQCVKDWNNFKRLFSAHINNELSLNKVKSLFKNKTFTDYYFFFK